MYTKLTAIVLVAAQLCWLPQQPSRELMTLTQRGRGMGITEIITRRQARSIIVRIHSVRMPILRSKEAETLYQLIKTKTRHFSSFFVFYLFERDLKGIHQLVVLDSLIWNHSASRRPTRF